MYVIDMFVYSAQVEAHIYVPIDLSESVMFLECVWSRLGCDGETLARSRVEILICGLPGPCTV